MELNVQIDSAQVNQMVADAILKSAIGEALDKAIRNSISDLGRSYDNPMEKVINAEIKAIISNILRTTYYDQIKDAVQNALAEKLTGEFCAKMMDQALDAMWK